VAPDFLDHAALPGQAPGLAGAKQKWAMYLTGIPDLHVTIEDLVAEDDKVAARRSYEGTHRGELLGIPATGKPVQIGGISIFRVAEGMRLTAIWPPVAGGRSKRPDLPLLRRLLGSGESIILCLSESILCLYESSADDLHATGTAEWSAYGPRGHLLVSHLSNSSVLRTPWSSTAV
jgi:predicted ester cyclase